jgi:hypothetical protein
VKLLWNVLTEVGRNARAVMTIARKGTDFAEPLLSAAGGSSSVSVPPPMLPRVGGFGLSGKESWSRQHTTYPLSLAVGLKQRSRSRGRADAPAKPRGRDRECDTLLTASRPLGFGVQIAIITVIQASPT